MSIFIYEIRDHYNEPVFLEEIMQTRENSNKIKNLGVDLVEFIFKSR